MQSNALVVNDLTKRYPDFVLDKVSFSVPCGTIVGLIGENGAGKSTTINAVLGMINRDSGSIELFGEADTQSSDSIRNQIGVVFDGNNYPDVLSAQKLNRVLREIYRTWDERKFFDLLKKMSLLFIF